MKDEFIWHDDKDMIPDTDPEYHRRTEHLAKLVKLLDEGYTLKEAEKLVGKL